MPPSDRAPSAYRFDAANEAWEIPFLIRVGRGLAVAPGGAGLLIQRTGDDGVLTLLPSGGLVASIIELAVREVPGRCDADPIGRSLDRLAPNAAWIGFVEGDRRAGRSRDRRPAGEPPDRAGFLASRDPQPGRPDPLPELPMATIEHPMRPTVSQTFCFPAGEGRLRVRHRFALAGSPADPPDRFREAAFSIGRRWTDAGCGPVVTRVARMRPTDWNDVRTGRLSPWRSGRPLTLAPEAVARAIARAAPTDLSGVDLLRHHVAVFGASGSGKSSLLVELARRSISSGRPTVVLDLHGDLGPRIVSGLAPSASDRVLAFDPSAPGGPGPGIAVLGGGDADSPAREVAQVVATLRRLSHDGEERYWGFRLERIFDTFVGIVHSEGGALRDVYGLLTDRRRREAAEAATRRPEWRDVLRELPALEQRNPEFLWPAASRLSKVVLDPRIDGLVSPEGTGVPIASALRAGRSVIVRLPVGELGPEGSAGAAGLLLGRIYFELTRAVRTDTARAPAVVILDEAHAIAPGLLAEMVSEGRKFGVAVVLATQYPERLGRVVRDAVAGAVGTHVMFRIPRGSAASSAVFLGVPPSEAVERLPVLPPGHAIVSAGGASAGRFRWTVPREPPSDGTRWTEAVARTRREFPDRWEAPGSPLEDEAILLAVLAASERGGPTTEAAIVRLAGDASRDGPSSERAISRLPVLVRRRLLDRDPAGEYHLTGAGAAALGMVGRTGARIESAEHRALLIEAFRLFARHGERLEIVHQGRFDTRLPDAIFRQLGDGGLRSPRSVARAVDLARRRWSWRYFSGQDVHVEAEVSGALRPERIRRGFAKARARESAVLFLVADAERARRVRRVLERIHAPRDGAFVWTLPRACAVRPADGPP